MHEGLKIRRPRSGRGVLWWQFLREHGYVGEKDVYYGGLNVLEVQMAHVVTGRVNPTTK